MWFFNQLIRLYPSGFRAEYGSALHQQFADEWMDAPSAFSRLRLLLQSLWEFLLLWPQIMGSEFLQDTRYCWRTWRKAMGVTLLAILSLSLAIGVSTGIFSILSATLYRSLPFAHAEELVELNIFFGPLFKGQTAFEAWAGSTSYLSGATAVNVSKLNLSGNSQSLRIPVVEVSPNFFDLLGTPIYRGRNFTHEEGVSGKGDVAILSHALFEQAYGGDLRILGQKIRINNFPLTVIGIAPPRFDYPDQAGLWTPTAFDWNRIPKQSPDNIKIIGRMKPHLSFPTAVRAFELDAAANGKPFSSAPEWKARLVSLREQLAGPIAKSVWVLFVGITSVLLIACANMANLLLTRYAARQREFQIRSSLGAGIARISQQILTECILLSLISGLLSLGIAHLTVQLGFLYFPPNFRFQHYEVFDSQVLLFAFLLSLLSGLAFGFTPVLLRRGAWAMRANSIRHALLALQFGLTVVLLASSLSIGEALIRLHNTDLGLTTKNISTATISLAGTRYEGKQQSIDYISKALAQVRAFPQFHSAAAIDYFPIATKTFSAANYKLRTTPQEQMLITLSASPDFFQTVGTPFLAGRDFTAHDTLNSEPVVIVNESYAKLDGGARAVLGQKLRPTDKDEKPATIIGVTRDIQFDGAEGGVMPALFRPMAQAPPNFFTIAIHHKSGNAPLHQLAAALQSLSPDVPVYDVLPLEQRVQRTLAKPNLYTIVLAFFGGFSLLLTLLNCYSICANAMAQRTREIAIRLAVGAQSRQVRAMILAQMLPAILLGLSAGFLLIPTTATLLTKLIETIQPATWNLRLLPLASLFCVAILAIWLKTRQVLRLDPAEALRSE
ncbi:ABC transporter permease [Bryobacter aggregatus]|uniref:ABC transporter permease n=1 Tax=Bryobacter aggregatus TaxID=360054 RepID=UPI0004E1BEAD|nr:ABC transporter permease [Bryobacter aggregatus]